VTPLKIEAARLPRTCTNHKMAPSDYFFINHTRKEFCSFDNNESIIHSIELAIYKNVGWQMTDDIRVESQLDSDTDIIDFLSAEDYRNTDIEGPTESEPNSSDQEEVEEGTEMME